MSYIFEKLSQLLRSLPGFIVLLWTVVIFISVPITVQAQSFEWYQKTMSSFSSSDVTDITFNSDTIYAVGRTECQPCASFIKEYTKDGRELKSKLINLGDFTEIFSVVVYGDGVYVGGRILKSSSNPNSPDGGGFVQKYDHMGNLVWTYKDTQYALAIFEIAINQEGIYAAGSGFSKGSLTRLNFNGERQWVHVVSGDETSAYNVITHNSLIYLAAGRSPNNRAYVFNADGAIIRDFPLPLDPAFTGMTIQNDRLYLAGFESGYGRAVAKLDLAGTQIWKKRFFAPHGITRSLMVTDQGVYVGGDIYGSPDRPDGMLLSHYDFDGNLEQVWSFEKLNAVPDAMIMDMNTIFMGGWLYDAAIDEYEAYVAQFSEVDLLQPTIVTLDDINNDGRQDVASLRHGYGSGLVQALVMDAETDVLINKVDFETPHKPQDFKVIPDLNGNNIPELAVLGKDNTTQNVYVEIRDSLSGDMIQILDFDPNFEPQFMAVVDDITGNDRAEIAVLGIGNNNNNRRATLKDAYSGDQIKHIWFAKAFVPLGLKSIHDINSNGYPELGMFGHNPVTGAVKVEIKDTLDGSWLRNYRLNELSYTAVDFALLPDINQNGFDEIVLLGQHKSSGNIKAEVTDMKYSARLQNVWFSNKFDPHKLVVVPDINNNGAPELALLGTNADLNQVRIELKDSKSANWLGFVFSNPDFEPSDVAVIADINGNDAAELVVLGKRSRDALTRAVIKDSLTNMWLGQITFY